MPPLKPETFYKRLDGYVDAQRHRAWDKLYGFISTVGRGGVDLPTFVAAMKGSYAGDIAQYPEFQAFMPYRSRKNGDGYYTLDVQGL